MSKQTKKSGGEGHAWYEAGKHWCQYPVASSGPVNKNVDPADRKRPGQQPRPIGSRPRRAARRLYAKQIRYQLTPALGFKAWLREQK